MLQGHATATAVDVARVLRHRAARDRDSEARRVSRQPSSAHDPSKWYVGVYSDWDQKNEILRGPEDRDNLSAWLTDANDDAGNARPAFIASKNVFFPEPDRDREPRAVHQQVPLGRHADDGQGEVSVRHLRHPELARRTARAPDEGRNGRRTSGASTTTRTSCTSTTGCTRSRSSIPTRVKYLDAAGYLERAYRTAVAYWTVPAGGGEVVGRRGRHHERSVHPGPDRHARRAKAQRTGRGRCAGIGRARSIASSTRRRTCTDRSSRSTRPASNRRARSRSTR